MQVQKLLASDAGPGRSFGRSVALQDDTLFVGSPEDDLPGEINAGSVYRFEFSAADERWVERPKIFALLPRGSDGFGSAVALDAGHFVVGAPGFATTGTAWPGAAYVFRRGADDWRLDAILRSGLAWRGAAGVCSGTARPSAAISSRLGRA